MPKTKILIIALILSLASTVFLFSIIIFNGMRGPGADITNADLEKITAEPSGAGSETAVISNSSVQISSSSSFGFHYSGNMYDVLHDLGAGWTREGIYIVWEWSDNGRNGSFRFTDAIAPPRDGKGANVDIDYDKQWLQIPEDLKLVANIEPFRKGGSFKNDAELTIYKDFVNKAVERYDGDNNYGCLFSSVDCYKKGDGQYPSQATIDHFKNNPIKYWQICNQLGDVCAGTDCRTTYASKYAEVMKASYESVKSADNSSYVLMAGDSKKEEYPAVFKELNGKYIDIIDFHRFGQSSWYDPQTDFDYLKNSLKSSGYDLSKLKFWMTETGTYAGDPVEARKEALAEQSEKQQAEGLVKAYVSGLGYGIEKMFWAWGIEEGFQRNCGIFDFTGIIYDGCDCQNGQYVCDQNGIGRDKGRGVKKTAYYSYKKITEKLESWDEIETVQKSGGIYIYKFSKNGKNIWVAWNDNTAEKTVTISNIISSQVKISEALPKYETGEEVKDYGTAFNEETKKIDDNKLTIGLNAMPVFIEVK